MTESNPQDREVGSEKSGQGAVAQPNLVEGAAAKQDAAGRAHGLRQKARGPAILVGAVLLSSTIVGATHLGRAALVSCPTQTDVGGIEARPIPSESRDVSLRTLSFKVNSDASPPIIARSGQLQGEQPPASHIWLIEQGDPRTSGSDGQPGDGLLYPIRTLKPDDSGCWTLTNTLGYTGINGMSFNEYIVLVSDSTNADFAYGVSGLQPNELYSRNMVVLAKFVIPTEAK